MQIDFCENDLRIKTLSKSWLLSFAAAALSILIACVTTPMYFATNDDPYIIQVLSGSGGVASNPIPYVPFINYILCLVITSLYKVTPIIPWWLVFQIVAIGISLTLIGRVILIRFRMSGKSLASIKEFLLLLIIDFGIGAYFVTRIQFTSTSALLFASAIVASCCWKSTQDTILIRATISRSILPIILASIGFALRIQSGLLGLFFWGLAVVALLISCDGDMLNRCKQGINGVVPFLVTCMLALVLTIVNTAIYSDPELDAGNKLGTAISNYTDYPRTTFSQNPSEYEAVDWDEPLAALASKWFMMDERINTEALTYINEQNTASVDELIQNPKDIIAARLHDVTQPVFLAYASIIIAIGIFALGFSQNDESIVVWIIGIVVIVLQGYLLLRGRLLERAAYSIILPAGSALLSMVLRNDRSKTKDKFNVHIGATIIAFILINFIGIGLWMLTSPLGKLIISFEIVFCIYIIVFLVYKKTRLIRFGQFKHLLGISFISFALLLACLPGLISVKKFGFGSDEAKRQEQLISNTDIFFDYVEKHPTSLYIYSNCPITMQNVWQEEWPPNQTGWGGWRFPYRWFDDAMREAGFNGRPKSSDFLNGHTYFVSASYDTCNLLLRYMRNTYGSNIEMIEVDSITDGIGVYQFIQTESK